MYKKNYFLILLIVFVILLTVNWGIAAEEAITWTAQCQFSAGSIEYDAFERSCERINLQSNGKLVIKPNSAGAIVSATEEFDAVDSGTLDLAMDTGNYWRDKWSVAALFDMEIGGMSAGEHYLWFLEGGGVELAREMLGDNFNIHIVDTALPFPQEIFLSTTKPINSLEDLKGMKIRTAGDDGEIFNQMGASITMVAGGELYEAMNRGTIDAFQFMSPAGDASIGLHEVVDYIYLSPVRQPCSLSMIIVNKRQWDNLTEDLRSIVRSSFCEEAWRFFGRITKADAEAIELYKERGVTVTIPPKEVEEEMTRLAEKMYKERAEKDAFYAKVFNSRHEWQEIFRSMYGRF